MGRWLSPDEAFADQHQANPQTWNLYAYTRNNPLRFVDQDGNVVHEAKTVYKTYDVHGKTAQDAADNALKASGMSADGEGMSGDTNAGYKIASSSLTFDQEMDGIQGQAVYDTMTLKSWVIQYTPVVTMPHWVEEGQASEADQKAWDTSMATLKKHEDGHVDIGRKGAHDLDDSLKGTKVTGSGATANEAETSAIKKMNADLRQKVKTNVEQTGQKQKDYDAATNHGRNQPQ
jgi:predicted secreted Zn-dependent protease